MDPFREDFDVEKAFESTLCPLNIQPCSSMNEYENNLILNEPEIFQALMRIEDGDFKMLFTNNSVKLGSEVSKKERMKRLQSICTEGTTPLIPKSVLERKVKQIRIDNQKQTKILFACAVGNIFDCFERWMVSGDRVYLKLRSDITISSPQEPNRLIEGVIIAYDKHWNLIMRDIYEIYTPVVRLKKVQASVCAMPSSVVYKATKHNNNYFMERELKCSFITGSSIICAYKLNDK